MQIDIDIIAIFWDGPHNLKEVRERFIGPSDYGIYQIYGTHNVYGSDTLLYIGKAQQDSFGERIPSHQEWIDWESSEIDIYLGRIVGLDKMTESKWPEWESKIDRAERLLIYYCSPPYNSKNITSYGEMKDTLVLNYKSMKKVPLEVSTFYESFSEEDLKVYQ